MKRSTILLSLSMIFTLFTNLLQAQNDGPPRDRKMSVEQRVQKRVDRLATRLELNKEQKDKIYTLQLEIAKERDAAKDVRKTKADGKLEEHLEAVKAILTEAQFEKYEKMARKKMGKRKGKNKRKGKIEN